MLDTLALLLLGCILGVFTGLTPGIHVNTLCILALPAISFFHMELVDFFTIMCSMSICHSFLENVPSVLLGVPDESTCLGVLPAHRLVQKGQGLLALKLAGFGSIMGASISLLLILPTMILLEPIEQGLKILFPLTVIFVSFYFIRIGSGRKRAMAIACFILSGILGFLILNSKLLSSSYSLFPAFTGLFGLSNLIVSFSNKSQNIYQMPYARLTISRNILHSSLIGSIGGLIVGLLPGVSPSQIGLILSKRFHKSNEGFLTCVSSINSSDAIFSWAALYLIGNARSGVSTIISKLLIFDTQMFLFSIGIFCISISIAYHVLIVVGRIALRRYQVIDTSAVKISIIIFVATIVFIQSGPYGFLILVTSTALGITPILEDISRTNLMGILIIPYLIAVIF